MKQLLTALFLLVCNSGFSQSAIEQLKNGFKKLEADEQFKHAITSLYVVDSKTGKVVFDKNSQIGLAPASCLKVLTSASAFELLGNNYQYKTQLAYEGTINGNKLEGDLYITASGDPSLGSWRWSATNEENTRKAILAALRAKNISVITGNIIFDDSKWESQSTPRGWIWEDIGNYYGAGARSFNWRENQYDLILKPGKKVDDSVAILATRPTIAPVMLINELKTGKAGSGDNSIIYLPENASMGYVRGTVPAGRDLFTVKGAMPDPGGLFIKMLESFLDSNNIKITGRGATKMDREKISNGRVPLLTLLSPPLDSINYWFLKESVNLFGEAFVKTIAYEKTGYGSTDTGLYLIQNFWSNKSIDPFALNIIDGSGLSPANRITCNALVTVMQYAKKQKWFPSFYNALPEMNGIRMKSGYISGVRSYTGYIKSKTGNEYSFSIIVNNFSGPPGTVREKMWKLLDILK